MVKHSAAATSTDKPKIRRSRNGCNECRRLHHRCDETKPACRNCVKDGKSCSYQRTVTWVENGNQRRPTRRNATEQPEQHEQHDEQQQQQQPPASTAVATASRAPAQPSSMPQILVPWLPWLSPRHRQLVAHFAHITCPLSCLEQASHHDLCSAILPLAVDSSHGFPLLSAILSVALTHRHELGVEPADTGAREAQYWETMAVGHLRRLRIHDGPAEKHSEKHAESTADNNDDETAENLFAATALMLSHRESFAGGERAQSWRAHLDGAMAVLRRRRQNESTARRNLHKLALAMHRLAQVFVLHPSANIGTSTAAAPLNYANHTTATTTTAHSHRPFLHLPTPECTSPSHFTTCNQIDDSLGISLAFYHTLLDIDRAAADMTALQAIERAAGPTNMSPLWAALERRIAGITAASGNAEELLRDVDLSGLGALDARTQAEVAQINAAYYFIVRSRIELHLRGCAPEAASVQAALEQAMGCLDAVELRAPACPAVALVQPVFAVGCYACTRALRARVTRKLEEVWRKYGRGNAQKAREFLEEFWLRRDADAGSVAAVRRLDLRLGLRTLHRAEDFEWTDLMAEKGWDLSLW